jgi:hypothetical protein
MKTGGGTQTVTADLPADWRQQMDDELREELKGLDSVSEMKPDEFTARDVVGLWVPTLQGTTRRLKALVEGEELAVRKAYDPRIGKQVNAYRRVT